MKVAIVRHADIQVARPLRWDVFDDRGVLLLRRGQVVANEAQLRRLIDTGVFAEVGALARTRADAPAAPGEPPPSAALLVLRARQKLALMLTNLDVLIRDALFVPQMTELVGLVDMACAAEPQVAQATILLRTDGRYAVRHMVNVAIVVRLVGHSLKLGHDAEQSLVAAALTMNLAQADFHDEMMRQNGPLTLDQRERLERHPAETVALLKQAGVTDVVWLRAVKEHHEHVDGSGYPAKLQRAALSTGGQLLGLADVFCARVTPKIYRPAVASNAALRGILLERGKAFDPTLAGAFIKSLGLFPPGMLVKLANGETGVVADSGASPHHPIVAAVVSAQGVPMSITPRRDTSLPEYQIVETVDPRTFSIFVNMEAIWGAAAAVN
jgi:HD-GYP domain-containing protein (c-di-GMP phosphodiesterase class II)